MGFVNHSGRLDGEAKAMPDVDLMDVAERLAGEFEDVPAGEVLQAVTSAIAENPDGDSLFVEQAARARLAGGSGENAK